MKIRIGSDYHLEFGPLELSPIGEDVMVLAGDIGVFLDGAAWARDYARRYDVPVVMIAGNHEFYRNRRQDTHTVRSTIDGLRIIANSEPLLHFLENDSVEIDGVIFVGCTLWTDFALQGQDDRARAMRVAYNAMNDYNLIRYSSDEPLTPRHTAQIHDESAAYLRGFLLPPAAGNVVVLTHHLPSRRSIAGRYADSDYNSAYASNLDDLVEASGAALWVHGHTHVSNDYRIGAIRVVCNPRGYDRYELNPEFNPDLIVEI